MECKKEQVTSYVLHLSEQEAKWLFYVAQDVTYKLETIQHRENMENLLKVLGRTVLE